MKSDLRELLYKSFDLELTPEERKKLQEALKEDLQLQAEQRKLGRLRKALASQKSAGGFPDVTDAVMKGIQGLQTDTGSEQNSIDRYLQSAFRPLLAAAIILIVLLSGINIVKTGEISLKAALSLQEASITEALDPTLTLLEE